MKRFIALAFLFLSFLLLVRAVGSFGDDFAPWGRAAASTGISTTTTLSAPASLPLNDTSDRATVTVTAANGLPVQGSVKLQILDAQGKPWGGSPFIHPLGFGGSTTYGLSLPANAYTLQAIFDSQGNYQASQSPAQKLAVGQSITTSTTIQVSPTIAPSQGDVPANNAVVRVTASDGTTPTGNVLLDIKGYPGSPFSHRLDASGQTYFHLATLPVGSTWQLQATYPGDGRYPASPPSSVATVQVVAGASGPVATTTTINAPAIKDGSDAVVQVTVASANGVPSGSVNLSVSGGSGIPANLNAQGVATYTLHPTGGPGDYTLDATYVPTGNFQASTAHGNLIVNPGSGGGPVATSLGITAPAQIAANDSSQTALVVVAAADGSIPTGQVTMSYTGPWPQSGVPFAHNLVNGRTTYTLGLPAGTYTMTATYPAQANYAASTATARLVVLFNAGGGTVPTMITITVPSPIVQNDPSAQAIVTVTAADHSTPTGRVTLAYTSNQGSNSFTQTLVNGRTAFPLASLPAGSYHLTATYPIQGAFGRSQTTTLLTVALRTRLIRVLAGIDTVANGRALQAAMDSANAGEIIELDAGGVYCGPVFCRLTAPPGITIRTSNWNKLPGPGQRVSANDSSNMAVIVAPGANASQLSIPYRQEWSGTRGALNIHSDGTTGFGYWTFLGLELRPGDERSDNQTGILQLGNNSGIGGGYDQGTMAMVPHDIVVDRCYIHGFADNRLPTAWRAVTLHAYNVTIQGCDIREISGPRDTQGIHCVNTPGNITLNNNYISGESENMMVGGSTSSIQQIKLLATHATLIQPGSNVTFSPSAMTGRLDAPFGAGMGQSWAILYGSWLSLDEGNLNQEYVQVIATTATTFTVASVNNTHDGRSTPFTIHAAYADRPCAASDAQGHCILDGPLTPTTGMDLVPANVTITNNTFEKPLKYNPYDPTGLWRNREDYYDGMTWHAKNLLELKSGCFFTIRNNIFQNNWYGADQYGFAVLFTPRGRNSRPTVDYYQGGPWTGVDNITFINNTIRHTWSGIQMGVTAGAP